MMAIIKMEEEKAALEKTDEKTLLQINAKKYGLRQKPPPRAVETEPDIKSDAMDIDEPLGESKPTPKIEKPAKKPPETPKSPEKKLNLSNNDSKTPEGKSEGI